MKTIHDYISPIAVAVAALATLCSVSIDARADQTSRWNVKSGLVLIDASSPFAIDKPSGGKVYAGGNAELGASIAVEYRMSSLIGLEAGIVYAKSPDVDDTINGNNEEIGEGPSFLPVLAGVNFHLADTEKFDFFVGPRVAFVQFGDFNLDIDGQSTAFEVDDEFVWGATAGLNYQLGDSRWSLVAEATYLDVDMQISEEGANTAVTNGFDPLIFNLGAAFRF